MKKLAFLLFFLSSIHCLAQINETVKDDYIGYKRNYLQTVLRDYHIIEYEKKHAGFELGNGNILYLFFDEELCTKYYWLVSSSFEQEFRDTLLSNGWKRKQENLFEKDSSLTCKISSMNEGQNTLFLVESKVLVTQAIAKEKEERKIALKEKPKPIEKAVTRKPVTQEKKAKEAPQSKYIEEPKFQGVKIWGWEVIKF